MKKTTISISYYCKVVNKEVEHEITTTEIRGGKGNMLLSSQQEKSCQEFRCQFLRKPNCPLEQEKTRK